MSRIMLKNISTAKVIVVSNNFRRELVPGREVPISREVYEDLMFDPGFNNLLAGHYVTIKGVEEENAVAPIEQNVYDINAINDMLMNKKYSEFAKFIANAAPAEKETVVLLAVNKRITDNGFVSLIQKYCGIDIISAINQKHLAEEN